MREMLYFLRTRRHALLLFALCAALLPPETLAASLVSCLVSSLTVGLVQAPAGGLAPRPAG